ncbi:cation transporter, partial [Fulvivirga kasyanovii]
QLEWLTIAYLISVVIFLYFVMANSQVVKAVFVEDLVSLFPSVAFLIASRFFNKSPSYDFPYGYHKAFTVAFIAGAIALLMLGLFILIDSVIELVKAEAIVIEDTEIFGQQVWMGWVMVLALIYSLIPAYLIGKRKLPLSRQLHIKVLYVDAKMQRADWMASAAGIIGIIGIRLGIWWADPVVAIFIAASIVKDGLYQVKASMFDLMEEIPKTMDDRSPHPLLIELTKIFLNEDWVSDVHIRMREHGLVFFGDVFIIPKYEENLIENIQKAYEKARGLDWKIQDLVIQPVKSLPNPNVTYQENHP